MQGLRIEIALFIVLMVTWVHGQECGRVMTDNSGTFTSPGYPDKLDHKLNCTWTVKASAKHYVRLTLDHIDLKNPFFECMHDYIIIDLGDGNKHKYCNDELPDEKTVTSLSRTLTMNLITDDFFRNGDGFSVSYVVVDRYGKPVESEEEKEEEVETGKVATATTTEKLPTIAVSQGPVATDAPVSVTAKTKKPKNRKGRKGKKGKKGKKRARDEEKRLRRQRKKEAKALRRKNKLARRGKGKKGKKAKRSSL